MNAFVYVSKYTPGVNIDISKSIFATVHLRMSLESIFTYKYKYFWSIYGHVNRFQCLLM